MQNGPEAYRDSTTLYCIASCQCLVNCVPIENQLLLSFLFEF